MCGLGLLELLVLSFALLWLLPLVPLVFYLLTLHRALSACAPANRRMEPALVWLQLIPGVHLVWQFFVVLAVSGSLRREFAQRAVPADPDAGQSLGLATCILSVCSLIPFLGILAALGSLVCWILYWVRIAGYRNQLVPAA
jgi:hypothetical protein